MQTEREKYTLAVQKGCTYLGLCYWEIYSTQLGSLVVKEQACLLRDVRLLKRICQYSQKTLRPNCA